MYQRGTVYYAWNPCTGRQETTGKSTPAEAQAVIDHWKRCAKDPAYRDAASKTLADGYELVLTAKRRQGKAEGTVGMYDQKLRQIARVIGEKRPLQDLMSPNLVDEYIEKRESEGVSPSTIFKELVAWRQVLDVSARKGWVTGDTRIVIPAYSPKYVPSSEFLPFEKWWPFLHALPEHRAAEAAYELAFGAEESACRRARRSFLGDDQVFVEGSKRATRARHVTVTSKTKPFLEFIRKWAPGEDLLFDHWASKTRDLSEAAYRIGHAHYVDRFGKTIPEVLESGTRVGRDRREKLFGQTRLINGLSSNDLRRSYGAMLAEAGVPFEIIARQMGHSSVNMVMRVYGRMRPHAVADAIKTWIPDDTSD